MWPPEDWNKSSEMFNQQQVRNNIAQQFGNWFWQQVGADGLTNNQWLALGSGGFNSPLYKGYVAQNNATYQAMMQAIYGGSGGGGASFSLSTFRERYATNRHNSGIWASIKSAFTATISRQEKNPNTIMVFPYEQERFAYQLMNNWSYMGNIEQKYEVLAFYTDKGIVVLPPIGNFVVGWTDADGNIHKQGESYHNGFLSSTNSYYSVSINTIKNQINYNSKIFNILGTIHIHPLTDRGALDHPSNGDADNLSSFGPMFIMSYDRSAIVFGYQNDSHLLIDHNKKGFFTKVSGLSNMD
jgi:hypothetical protein